MSISIQESVDHAAAELGVDLEALVSGASSDEYDITMTSSETRQPASPLCNFGYIYGCRDNGCAGVVAGGSCSFTRVINPGTPCALTCTYTLTVSPSYCNSSHNCACGSDRRVSTARWCPIGPGDLYGCTPS